MPIRPAISMSASSSKTRCRPTISASPGIRLLGHINSQEKFDEIAAFLGASYFRSVGRDQVYGLSARGLALKTADADGEEFPLFRAYWVEKPTSDSDSVVVHALLDSASVSGAYRFTIKPGDVDGDGRRGDAVSAGRSRPRSGSPPARRCSTSAPNGREKVDDYRPEVHDSDGLLMVNWAGRAHLAPARQSDQASDQRLRRYRAARFRPDAAQSRSRNLPGLRSQLRAQAEPLGRAGRRLGRRRGGAGRDPERLGDQRQHRRLLAAQAADHGRLGILVCLPAVLGRRAPARSGRRNGESDHAGPSVAARRIADPPLRRRLRASRNQNRRRRLCRRRR